MSDTSVNSPDEALAAVLAHIKAGRLGEAEAACRAIAAAQPNHAEVFHLLGAIALQRGDAVTAIGHCRRAVSLAPNLAKAHSNLGAALSSTGKFEEALAALRTATTLDPNLASAQVNLGDALIKVRRFAEAEAVLERAVALQPENALAQINLGAALARQDRAAEAVCLLTRVIERHPGLVQAYSNLGFALYKQQDYRSALAVYERARALTPTNAEIFVSLGLAHGALGRSDEALAAFDRAITLRPGFEEALFFRALELLRRGRFAEGWRDYGHRFSMRKIGATLHRQPLAADLSGMRVLLRPDQGLGDEIFFLRFVPELQRRGAHVTYLGNAKIASLLRRVPVLDAVITEESDRPLADLHISVGDLPFLLGMRSADEIPPPLAIAASAERSAAQRAALAALGPPPYIGVTWRAGTDGLGALAKSVPLEALGAVLGRSPGTLVALQRMPAAGEIAAIARHAGKPMHDLTVLNEQLEDMLALLDLLDDYITVSNTNVHLRAALGKGSRVLVPWPPEFRWMAKGDRSPWFPESRVYRQAMDGSWERALTELTAHLECAPPGGTSR